MLRLLYGIILLETATGHGVFGHEKESKGPCVDKYSICSYWARQGECQKNADYMMDNCKRSCFFCGDLDCDVGIVGGGISGLYMAYKLLVKKKEKKVCVFERETNIGGRIFDYRFKETPDIHVGLGAWRISKNNPLVMAIVKELGISYHQLNIRKPTLYESRGTKANNSDTLKKCYPNLLSHPLFGNMTSGQLLSFAMRPEHVATARNFATTGSYFSHYITPEGMAYLSEITFKGNFEEFISPESYLELLKNWKLISGKYVRPPRGLSEVPRALSKRIVSLGGKIFTNSPVKQLIDKQGRYFLITPSMRTRAKKLVIALTPLQIQKVTGNVAERIKQTAQLKSVKPIQVFRAAAVYGTPWWEKATIAGTPVVKGQVFVSFTNCVGHGILYWGNGTRGESVLNTLYTNGACARKWRDISQLGTKVIGEEVHRAMEMKYGMKIPKPLDTIYKFWDAAWHFQKAGFNFSLNAIANWAKRPFPGEDISLVNEGFSIFRGWSEGSLTSCQNALDEGWGDASSL